MFRGSFKGVPIKFKDMSRKFIDYYRKVLGVLRVRLKGNSMEF